MYLPKHFEQNDRAALVALMRERPLATLVIAAPDGPTADLIPLEFDAAGNTLRGHVARANPLWKHAGAQALAIFTGPEAYVSPSWYATKATTGNRADVWPEKACFKTSLLGRAVPRGVGWQGAWGDRRRQPGERWCPLPR